MRDVLYIVVYSDAPLDTHYLVMDSEISLEVPEEDVIECCSTSGTYLHRYARNENSIGINFIGVDNENLETGAELISELLVKYNLSKSDILKAREVNRVVSELDSYRLWNSLINKISSRGR